MMHADTVPILTHSPAPHIPLLSPTDPWMRTIYPIGAYAIQGIGFHGDQLIALDTVRGYLLEIDPATDNTRILNSLHAEAWIGAEGLAIADGMVWFGRDEDVFYCRLDDFVPQHFTTLNYPVNGIAVAGSTVYVASQRSGYIHIFEREGGRLITRLPLPGVGPANLVLRGEELWLCDRIEQTVYCLDRATGEQKFCLLTPFDNPTGVAFHTHPETGQAMLYVAYAGEEMYIRDNPNEDPPHELTGRDRTFIHPLHFHYDATTRCAVSNGYLIEMVYTEELLQLDAIHLDQVEWRIALPAETDRQKIRHIEAIGRPFVEEIQQGQRVARFTFDALRVDERHIFGWKALLEVRGIKYQLTFDDVDRTPGLPPEMAATYLVDNDDLAMDTPVIQRAAREAIGTETNILRKVLKIRNYVYDRLSYGIKPHIDTPDVVLERGTGSCGEYVGLLLALLRLNGVACRTVGRYKCPPHAERCNIPLQPDYNHVWIEFYIPGFGWLPMESNPDDIGEGGPYPTRFFMGLPWYHAEIAKGISFESVRSHGKPLDEIVGDLSIGDLAINHVRFTIRGELPPITEASV